MPKQNLIGPFIRRFLLEELVAERNLAVNTQKSYRDTVRLLFAFITRKHATNPAKVTVEQVDAALVRSFLIDLEQQRGNSVATRNQRLAALHSLFGFISRLVPDFVDQAAQIQAIPLRLCSTPVMPYLEKHEIDALLAVPDRRHAQGNRDYALLLFLYNCGARASEAAELTVDNLSLGTSPFVRLFGKGRKYRNCPLWTSTTNVLREMLANRLQKTAHSRVFVNVRKQSMTRHGVHALIKRTVEKAAQTMPSLLQKRISPHTIRHTTAVHLLRSGVDINTIRAWLGHVSLQTTNRYAEIDLQMKAKALETCAVRESHSTALPSQCWRTDNDLMTFLASL